MMHCHAIFFLNSCTPFCEVGNVHDRRKEAGKTASEIEEDKWVPV